MTAFLVRESLWYSEFAEAIARLHEDKLGIKQEEKDYGLPDDEADEWEDWPDWWPDEDPPEEEEKKLESS